MPFIFVATAPTVYGIETFHFYTLFLRFRVATAPTVYGIETYQHLLQYWFVCQ